MAAAPPSIDQQRKRRCAKVSLNKQKECGLTLGHVAQELTVENLQLGLIAPVPADLAVRLMADDHDTDTQKALARLAAKYIPWLKEVDTDEATEGPRLDRVMHRYGTDRKVTMANIVIPLSQVDAFLPLRMQIEAEPQLPSEARKGGDTLLAASGGSVYIHLTPSTKQQVPEFQQMVLTLHAEGDMTLPEQPLEYFVLLQRMIHDTQLMHVADPPESAQEQHQHQAVRAMELLAVDSVISRDQDGKRAKITARFICPPYRFADLWLRDKAPLYLHIDGVDTPCCFVRFSPEYHHPAIPQPGHDKSLFEEFPSSFTLLVEAHLTREHGGTMSPFLPPPRPTKDRPPSLDKMEADLRGILKQYTSGQVVPTVVGHLQHLPRSMQPLWQTQLSITLQTPYGLDSKLPLPQEMTPWVPLAGQGETGVQFSVCCAEPVPAAAVPTATARANGAIRLVRKQPIQLEAHLPALSSALPSRIVFGESIAMQRPASKLKRKDPVTALAMKRNTKTHRGTRGGGGRSGSGGDGSGGAGKSDGSGKHRVGGSDDRTASADKRDGVGSGSHHGGASAEGSDSAAKAKPDGAQPMETE